MKNLPVKLQKSSTLAIAFGALALIMGCGHAPVAPLNVEPGTYADPKFVAVPTGHPGIYGAAATGPLTGSLFINGAVGGVLTVGRFSVNVPAGAIADTATITISIPDQSIVECNLSISPESANGFRVPVTLSADCSGAINVDLSHCGTLWYDPQSGLWRTVGGACVDLVHGTVSASLMHFSTYGVADLVQGKAGW